mmetsp:Transcript_13491/g.40807  ORF Transcript_13491/g.40807 Transcript_13491/m.40807 type:complete len:143 (+) Transcript_13491:1168-1596(+)
MEPRDWATEARGSHSSQLEGLTQMLSSRASASDCIVCMSLYTRPKAISSAWVPSSTTLPADMTTILSQLRMVDNLWATKIEVRPVASSVRLSMMPRSVAVSSADVASSQIKSRGSLRKARAIATRCFSPPDSFRPRSPTMVM